MAKGSVRKKGKKWYYRFYVENESGNLVQREFVGTESKSGTEAMLRKAMDDYEEKKFVAKSENLTVGNLLDMWVEEELKPGNLSNGTVMSYVGTVARIKKHPIAQRKLKTVTADHLQAYMDLLSFGGKNPDGTTAKFSAVLQGAFRFAVFPKKLITFNPMQYVVWRQKKNVIELFSDVDEAATPTVTHKQYLKLTEYLKVKQNPALLPIQIAYYTGLRIGEVCGLTWSDINLDEQYLTVGTTKRNKVRTVDFCDTLSNILRQAKAEQEKNAKDYGELYSRNFYVEVTEKDRQYYEVYSLSSTEEVPDSYKPINLVCLRPDGTYESPSTVGTVCRAIRKKVEGLENFHFHMLRHTFTSNLLSGGAAPKDVQELLGHSDVSTTMNIYAHASREAKRTSARLLDKVVGE